MEQHIFMVKSLVLLKETLASCAVKHKLPKTLNSSQWSLIENMLTILEQLT